MLEDNPKLQQSKFTGYPLLLHIITTLVIGDENLGEKNILEIG
jgi:hypothetical protein